MALADGRGRGQSGPANAVYLPAVAASRMGIAGRVCGSSGPLLFFQNTRLAQARDRLGDDDVLARVDAQHRDGRLWR